MENLYFENKIVTFIEILVETVSLETDKCKSENKACVSMVLVSLS